MTIGRLYACPDNEEGAGQNPFGIKLRIYIHYRSPLHLTLKGKNEGHSKEKIV